jgi:predicted Zn-dependent protease
LTAEHAIISVRAKVLSNPGVDALRSLVQEADGAKLSTMPAARQMGVLYGAALAASRLRDFVQALALLDRLKWQAAADIKAVRLYRLLKAEVALAAGDSALALASLSAAGGSGAALEPLTRPELLLWAQLAQPAEVAQRLQLWVAAHPRDATAWQQLSTAYAAQGQTVRAISADAEARVALLDYPAALDRFKAAQELSRQSPPGNAVAAHVDASIIDARKRQVEALLKEQSVER